jgi:hypothetical protein
MPDIVGVEEGHVVAARGGDAGIARRGYAPVFLPDHAHRRAVAL